MAEPEEPSRRNAVAALVVIAVLVVLAVLMVRGLRRTAALQDCVASGRRDCMPVNTGGR